MQKVSRYKQLIYAHNTIDKCNNIPYDNTIPRGGYQSIGGDQGETKI